MGDLESCHESCPVRCYSPFQLYRKSFREIFQEEFLDLPSYESVLETAGDLAAGFLSDQHAKFSRLVENLKDFEREQAIEQIHALQYYLADSKSSLLHIQTDGLMALDTIYALARERALEISNVFKKRPGGLQGDAPAQYSDIVFAFEATHDLQIEMLSSYYRKFSRAVARWHQQNLVRFIQSPPDIDVVLPPLD